MTDKPKQRKPRRPKTLREGWLSFARQVIHPEAPIAQRIEMRNAYYAAAAIVLEQVSVIAENPDEEQAVKDLGKLNAELEAFVRQIAQEAKFNN